MKAAVIEHFGDTPRYRDFDDPVPAEGDLLIRVKAVPLENFDKLTAAGKHYASKHMFPYFPAVVGHIGVGELHDGTLVAFGGGKPRYGAMAEQTVVPKEYRAYMTPLPEGVDSMLAAALPAPALTSLLPLKYGLNSRPGETVLINGATGVSGKLAVQVAMLLGAGKVTATGRDDLGLSAVLKLGADAVIDTRKSDEEVKEAFLSEAGEGYDVVLDYLWGRPTELLLQTLVPKQAGFPAHKTRLMQIGQAAGPTITLAAEQLRTSGVLLTGTGDVPAEAVPQAIKQVWEWMKDRKLTMDVEPISLKDVAEAWERKTDGKRIVIVP
jgi:NADPH:quinone reductase-like Zn-dependent oxidoreductase